MTKFLNISVDNTLGGNSPSDVVVSSQKAVKDYIDAHSGGSVLVDDVTINRDSNQKLQAIGIINKNGTSGAISPLGVWNGTEAQWNQGEATTWYNWLQGGTSITSGADLPSTNNISRALNDGANIYFFSNNEGAYYYSSDGENWSSGTTPVTENTSVCYGNGVYLSFYVAGTSYAYSTDGISWSSKTAPLYGVNQCVYGDKFVCVLSANAMYSTDGENWSSVSLPIEGYRVTYGNNLYVAMGSLGGVAYSSDGVTWTTATTSPTSATSGFNSLAYGNGKYVAICSTGNTVAYSDDANIWTTTTNLPRSQNWGSVTYGDGYFLAAGRDSQYAAYSTDGINWTEITLPASGRYWGVTYMGDTFYGASSNSASTFKVSFASSNCFTAEANPTTESTVYSAVSTPSDLTITSVGTGTITLSDGKTYAYNPSGNDFSYRSVGETHPDWLCNINGVGVKIGTEFIAKNSNGADTDNKSITKNASQELQTIGVIDSNNTTNAIKVWTGTKARYKAIASRDANTLYNITDDTDVTLTILEALYPVGSVYITTANTCPLSTLISGSTWTLRSSGVVTSVDTNVPVKGTGKTLGLTNGSTLLGITRLTSSQGVSAAGAFAELDIGADVPSSSDPTRKIFGITTDESKSGIIGTVTRTTLSVNIFERTA